VRTPSWTDRVLWHSSRPEGGLHQLAYTSGSQVLSDHKPVAAAFLLRADEYQDEAVEALLEEGWRELDLLEMSSMPKCDLSARSIDLGELDYGCHKKFVLALQNTGSIAAHFRFVENPGLMVDNVASSASSVTPRWLEIDPLEGFVEAGATAELSFTVVVVGGPDGCAHHIQEELRGLLDVILVLHIAGGADFFISLSGRYNGSCFGVPLASLRPPEYHSPDSASEDFSTVESSRRVLTTPHLEQRVPAVVLQLSDFLVQDRRLATPFLFLEYSSSEYTPDADFEGSVLAVRQALERGEAVPAEADPHAVAACLLSLFMALPESFMPETVVKVCELCLPSASNTAQVVKSSLGDVEYATFCHMTALMRLALQPDYARENRLSTEAVSSILASAWFPPLLERFSLLGENTGTALDTLKGVAENAACIDVSRAEFVSYFLSSDFDEAFDEPSSISQVSGRDFDPLSGSSSEVRAE